MTVTPDKPQQSHK